MAAYDTAQTKAHAREALSRPSMVELHAATELAGYNLVESDP